MARAQITLLLPWALAACGPSSNAGTGAAELLSGSLLARPLDGARGAYGIYTGGYGTNSGPVTTEVAVTMVFSEENIDVCAALTAASSALEGAVVAAAPVDSAPSASAPPALLARASLQDAAALSLRITTAKSVAPYPGAYLAPHADANAAVGGVGAVTGVYRQPAASATAAGAPLQIGDVCLTADASARAESGQIDVEAVASALAGAAPGDLSGHFQLGFRHYQQDANGLLVGGDSAGDVAGNFRASHCPILDLTSYLYATAGG